MAFLADDPNDPKKQQPGAGPQDGAQQGNATVLSAPSASMDAGSTTAPTAAPAANQPSHSGSFTNLHKYLDTNEARSGEMGAKVEGLATTQAKDLNDTAGTVKTTAQAAVDKGTFKPVAPGTDITKMSDNDFTNAYTAKYTGPKDIGTVEGAGDVQAKQAKLAGSGASAADYSGQQDLLRNTFEGNGRQYDRGGGMLDTYLVGGNTNAFGNVAKTADDNQNVYSGLQSWMGGAADEATKATDAAREQFHTAAADTARGLDARLTTARNDAAVENNSSTYDSAVQGDPDAIKQVVPGISDVYANYISTLPQAQRQELLGTKTVKGIHGATETAGSLQHLLQLMGADAAGLGLDEANRGADFSGTDQQGIGPNAEGINTIAGKHYVDEATKRWGAGQVSPEEITAVTPAHDRAIPELAKSRGIDINPFIHADPSSPYGYSIDTAGLSAALGKTQASSLAVNKPLAEKNAKDAAVASQVNDVKSALSGLADWTNLSGSDPQSQTHIPNTYVNKHYYGK